MRVHILIPLLILWRICHAGWPCCLKGQRDDPHVEANQSTKYISIDIARPKRSEVDVKKRKEDGVEHREYYPKGGRSVCLVQDGHHTIWQGIGEEESIYVETQKKGRMTLLVVDVVESDTEYEHRFFVKEGQGWREVQKDEFHEKQREMRSKRR